MPPVEYFAAMASEFTLSVSRQGKFVEPAIVYLEACENYQKQSYRNRCHIFSAAGKEALSFPIVHDNSTHSNPICQVRVDYSTPWVRQQERAIVSAYRTSAFFEYYQDELFAILESRPETLWELNMLLIRFFAKKIGIAVDIRETTDFLPADGICTSGAWTGMPVVEGIDAVDLRGAIHPKKENDILERLGKKKPYFQVFSGKHGFIGNLSIMDLLFNEGPESISLLYRASMSF
ncbi:MAG: WbqC family protein [Clostridium sp.]|nr:WbqC family protein [Bacteroides sp.]MCM1198235.1 WbqC family protein [Clostridium sp.]